MENTIDHGDEPARFPCIETEKALSRAQGLTKATNLLGSHALKQKRRLVERKA